MKSKLKLNKKTVTSLTKTEMDNVKGGFTYSLSLGSRCKNSKSLGAGSQFECGQMLEARY